MAVAQDRSHLDRLAFRFPFRTYQRLMLARVDAVVAEHGGGADPLRLHLVAPPGSGKTIVGLELIRRFGDPAVVFAPTVTVQHQWCREVGMFCDDAEMVAAATSTDPRRLAAVNAFTYQLISTPAESDERLTALALGAWAEELVRDGQAADDAAANERIETLARNNPQRHRREVARREVRIKRGLLRGGEDVRPYLHANARELVDRLVEHGVRTVVLDECHHLLDYWAIAIAGLVERIDRPRVVGLTATLPSVEDGREYDNYMGLLGEVDFEVPTPAVVKEGDLAPYRDLVHFVEPSARERRYLDDVQGAFERAVGGLTGSTEFRSWVRATVAEQQSMEEVLRERPLLAVAGLRLLRSVGEELPRGAPTEAEASLDLDDWAAMLERYGLDILATSPDPHDHEQLKQLRLVLRGFGLTLTERGLRQGRSVGDLILTFSESKDDAVAAILEAEAADLGDRMRALVVTDFERMTSAVGRAGSILDRDAGSAQRVMRHLVHDPRTTALEPILVTGRSLLVDADHGDELLQRFAEELEARKARAACRYRPTDTPGVLEVVGEGPDWGSRTYVRMVTDAFEHGITRCLVGTRGIFGEGWDALRVNVLVDLTSVTTSTSVQQLRGRSIRLDPDWPHKVAHNWDVICLAPAFERGDVDARRFERRHGQYWGVVPVSSARQFLEDAAVIAATSLSGQGSDRFALGVQAHGQVVKGVSHVDPQLAWDLATKPLARIPFDRYTAASLKAVGQRERSYAWWGVGADFDNFAYRATRIDARDLRIRTVHTVSDTLRALMRRVLAILAGGVLAGLWLALYLGGTPVAGAGWLLVTGLALLAGIVLTVATNLRPIRELARRLLREQPPDAILRDVGHAVLGGLQGAGLVSPHLQPEYVRVVEQPDLTLQVLLDYASPEDAAVFVDAYRQVFDPVADQRYLILRTDGRLPSLPLRAVWLPLRTLLGRARGYPPAYHPVPAVLGANRERADAYAAQWARHVGGGKVAYTRSEDGRRVLFEARAQRRPDAKSLAFDVWR